VVPDELMPDPEKMIADMMDLFDDPAKAQYHARMSLASTRERLEEKPTIKDTHRASVSRSLRRLEERGLIDRETIVWRERDGERKPVRITNGTRTTKISLTEAGKEAGEEILRRVSDGRYNLAYDTLSEDGVRI
jgi:DNA-binding Lrp family transcriptional regulator